MRSIMSVLAVLAGVALVPGQTARAQVVATASYERGPRFLLARDSKVVPVDVSKTPVLARRLNLDLAGATLKEALTEIESQSGLRLSYSDDVLPLEKRVHLRAEAITAAAALTDVLFDAGVDVVFKLDGSAALVKRPPPPPTGSIVGRVTNAQSGEAIEGIEMHLQGTQWRTLTGTDGQYRLADVDTGTYVVTARRIGYTRLSRSVTVVEGQEITADFALQAAVATLGEVVVTAQKREESLKDVPISVSVVPGDVLDKSTVPGITEMLNRVPGVATTATVQNGGTQVAVRGVTAGGPLFSGSNPIAYYLDGVPFGLVKTAILPDANAYDLDRVEVLRGPQGTLYGASAQNGVVRVLTKDANLNAFEVKARTLLSSTGAGGENLRGDMAVNVPIVSGKLAARAVLGYQELSGWLDNPTENDVNDATRRNMRLKLSAQPTDALSIGLSAWLSRDDYGAPSLSAAGDPERIARLVDQQAIATDYDVYGLRVGYEFSGFAISSMTSYLDYANTGNLDIFVIPSILFTGLDSKVFAQEVILHSTHDGSWRWSVGAMYRDAEDRLLQTFPGVLPVPTDLSDGSESVAIFGELGRRFFNNRLEWTLGLRYFHDDVINQENVQHQGLPDVPLIRQTASFDPITPRAVLTWYPNSDLTVYGSYAEGFRSGFPQNPQVTQVAPDFPPLRPDKLHNYEIGAKGSLWDRRIAFDMAVYYIDWQRVQEVLLVPFAGTFVTAPVNSESASGIGLDFGVTTQPVAGLELGVNFSWNDLTMDSALLSGDDFLLDKGDRRSMSPEYTVGASADYGFPIGKSGFEGRFSTSANYTSEQFIPMLGGPPLVGDPMLIARASFSLDAPNRWSATIFADNINNERDAIINGSGILGNDWRVRPRTIGAQLEYR